MTVAVLLLLFVKPPVWSARARGIWTDGRTYSYSSHTNTKEMKRNKLHKNEIVKMDLHFPSRSIKAHNDQWDMSH